MEPAEEVADGEKHGHVEVNCYKLPSYNSGGEEVGCSAHTQVVQVQVMVLLASF